MLIHTAHGQAFQNLDFEDSSIVTSIPFGNGFNGGTADVPGWTSYNAYGDVNYSGGMTLIYDDRTLDEPTVALWDSSLTTPLQGQYSIFMYGGSGFAGVSHTNAAIGQTGQIPVTAKSITYLAQGLETLEVSFKGQMLSVSPIATTPNYTVYGADISAYAGQTGELLFNIDASVGGTGLLDDIQFSASPVPEPDWLGFFVLGGLLLGSGRLLQTFRNPKRNLACSISRRV